MEDSKSFALQHAPLFLEAERLASEIEQALNDPAATPDAFFQAVDRFAEVLAKLHQKAFLARSPMPLEPLGEGFPSTKPHAA